MSATRHVLRIRPASVADLDDVQAIGRATYLEHFASIWSPAGLERFLQRDFADAVLRDALASAAQAWFLVETPEAGVVGYAKVNWAQGEPASGAVGAELQKIYFRTATVGHGHGARLLRHVIDVASMRGERLLWLNVLKTNAGARRFYAKHGFDTTGERPFRSDLGEDIGMWLMSRAL